MTDVNMDCDEDPKQVGFDPLSLLELCLKYVSSNIRQFCELKDDHIVKIHEDVIWPAEICNKFFNDLQQHSRITDELTNVFLDTNRTRLTCVNIKNSNVSDTGMKTLLAHYLESVEISHCENLTPETYQNILHYIKNIKHLCIGPLTPIFPIFPGDPTSSPNMYESQLQSLVLKNHESLDLRYYTYMFHNLTHLELTGIKLFLPKSANLPHLVSLSLYHVWWLDENVDFLCSLTNLRHLDISQHVDRFGKFTNPNEKLGRIVTSLPYLKSLDISGTNLAGGTSYDTRSYACDIPGLSSRIDTPLDFLGLYGTANLACCRHDIPAFKISGHKDEDQILTAATLYMGRPEVLTRVLNDLYHLFRYESKKLYKALMIVLRSMDAHVNEKHIQICGSATLFYIVKGKKSESMGVKLRRHIITTLLNGMQTHLDDPTMMRNGCLTLCQFKIPADVVFDYKRIINILLKGVSNNHQENFVQRIAIYLLNSLACQVDAAQKKFLGDCGVISIMLNLITDRVHRNICDDVLEVAWSTMWNVTDETPMNCERFLRDSGLNLFLDCLKHFSDKEELLRNMMGLLGNVAEVKKLRHVFMSDFIMMEFLHLLQSDSDGIEVSYNAAGVISHLACDGELAWTIKWPTRQEMLKKMVEAINRWNIDSKRNINYRSFEPLVVLLKAYHTPECQHWAIWALANLTTVYPEKYCSLVRAENGIQLLSEIINHPAPYESIKRLANIVLSNCSQYAWGL